MGTLARTEFASLTLKERLQMKKKCAALLLDTSGSMNEEIEPGRSKMRAMRDAVDGLQGSFEIFAFDSTVKKVTRDTIPDRGRASTFMGLAINHLKAQGIMSAVMITDGDATDKPAALDAVKGFNLQILYVGGGKKPPFLDELAKAGGGYCTQDDIKLTKELTDKVQNLLGPGVTPKGDIQL